jgi:hypothetical protein
MIFPLDCSQSPASPGLSEDNIIPGTTAEAAANLETVPRMYYTRHSFQVADVFLANFLTMVAKLMIEALKARTGLTKADHINSLRSTLLLCLKGLNGQGRNIHCTYVIYRLLRDSLEPMEVNILRGYIATDEENDSKPLDPQQARSHFPITIMRLDEDPEASFMVNMVKEYNTMVIEA